MIPEHDWWPMKILLMSSLLLLTAADAPKEEPKTELPPQIQIGFVNGAQDSKLLVCTRVTPEKMLCIDFQEFANELEKRGKPLPPLPSPVKEI